VTTTSPSFLRRAGPLVVARFASALITLSIPLVLARMLSLPDYGTYKQLFLIFQTLYFILPMGMPASLYFFVPRTSAPRPYFAQTILYLLIAGVLAAAAIVGVASLLASFFSNPRIAEFRAPLAVYTAAMMAACPLETSLTAQGRIRASAVTYLVSDFLRAAAMVVPVLLGFGLAGVMVANSAFAIGRMLVAWFLMLKTAPGPWWSTSALRAQVAYALPFGAAMALAIPQQYLHQYVVSGAFSPELFALYAVGCFQLPIVDLLYTPTSEVLMVRLAELDREGRPADGLHAFREAAAKLSFVFIPASAFLFAAAPEFIGGLFGARFLPAVPLFRTSVMGVALAALPLDGALRARSETRHIFTSYLVKALVNVPLVLVAVRVFGLWGGVASWTLAEMVGKGMLLWRLPRALSSPQHRVSLWRCLPLGAMARAVGAAIVAAVGVRLLRGMASGAWTHLPAGTVFRALPLLAAALLFGTGYLVALSVVGVRPLTALAALRRRSPMTAP
jgi:O-antigen/teichoic acid export membrane protein